jgi:hypothetical protein
MPGPYTPGSNADLMRALFPPVEVDLPTFYLPSAETIVSGDATAGPATNAMTNAAFGAVLMTETAGSWSTGHLPGLSLVDTRLAAVDSLRQLWSNLTA